MTEPKPLTPEEIAAITYDIGVYDSHQLLIAATLSDVFKSRIVPLGDPNDDGDELLFSYGKYIGCPDDQYLRLFVDGINRFRGRPDFLKILREKVFAEVGRQLLEKIHDGEVEFTHKG